MTITLSSSMSWMAYFGPSRPGILDAAIGHVIGAEGRYFVDQYAADFEIAKGIMDPAVIVSKDAGLQAKVGIVDCRYGFLKRVATS